MDNGADRFTFMHQIERFVDLVQRQTVGNERIELNFARHRIFYHARQLGAAFDAAKGRTAPDATGDQLERTGFDLLPGSGHADDDAFAPALVAALQRRTHHVDVTDALEAEVDAAVGEVNNHLLHRLVVVVRVDEIGRAHFSGQLEFLRVGIHGQNASGL